MRKNSFLNLVRGRWDSCEPIGRAFELDVTELTDDQRKALEHILPTPGQATMVTRFTRYFAQGSSRKAMSSRPRRRLDDGDWQPRAPCATNEAGPIRRPDAIATYPFGLTTDGIVRILPGSFAVAAKDGLDSPENYRPNSFSPTRLFLSAARSRRSTAPK